MNRKEWLFVFVAIMIGLVLASMFMDLYLNKAYGDYLDLTGHYWNTEPVFCIIKPANMTAFEELGYSKYQLIKYVNLWKIKLNHYTDSRDWKYTTVFMNGDSTTEWCSVRIYFMDTGKKEGGIGVTECYTLRKDPDKPFCDITIFTKYLKGEFIGSTITHEVGHALGLGHRLAYTPCDFAAVVSSFDIMMAQAGRHQKITDDDLNALLSIYGDDGFAGLNTAPLDKHEINRKPLKCA